RHHHLRVNRLHAIAHAAFPRHRTTARQRRHSLPRKCRRRRRQKSQPTPRGRIRLARRHLQGQIHLPGQPLPHFPRVSIQPKRRRSRHRCPKRTRQNPRSTSFHH